MNDDHGNSPQIKLLLGELNAVWGRFERNLSTKEEQLNLVLEFQGMMSEVCNVLINAYFDFTQLFCIPHLHTQFHIKLKFYVIS